ncbi:MAG: hypothetical protein P8046_14500 [Anaerolineales bacterium]
MFFEQIIWFGLTLAVLAWLQPRLHTEIQRIFLLITRSPKTAILLFALVFLPGVFLHELSHFLTAKLLRVPTGRFSVFPRELGNQRLQMGFVEVAVSDPVRESLIGAAPLLTGSAFVAYVGFSRLEVNTLVSSAQLGLGEVIPAFFALFHQPDVWLWLYLALTVSSTMFPSASDRRPWLKVAIGLAIILGVLLVLGAGYWLLDLLQPGLTRGLTAAAMIFGISAGIHMLLLLPLVLLRILLTDLFNRG